MKRIAVLGAGNIGSLIACLLAGCKDYHVNLLDTRHSAAPQGDLTKNITFTQLDVTQTHLLEDFLIQQKPTAIVSSLPYFFNIAVAELAKKLALHYFDLTEDVVVSKAIEKLAVQSTTAFAPHCGVAPGFINILTNDLMQSFDKLESVQLRVGNLPVHSNNALHYALLWSVDGVINEYGNICRGIVNGEKTVLQPLEDLEIIEIDGTIYEAFNTSGGVGSLVDTHIGKLKNLNYKTLRYPGHCEKIKFLMKDLKLNEQRDQLKKILENALPKTTQDVVIIYVTVIGIKNEQLMEETVVKKIYPQTIHGQHWTAIQVTTASALCAVLDIVLTQPQNYRGMVLQEQFTLAQILANRFGTVFQTTERE